MTPRAVTLAAKDRIAITLPWAVVVPDNAKACVIGGEIWNTKRYTAAKDNAHMIALLVAKRRRIDEGRVQVSVIVYPPDRRKRDITNTLKLICDAMCGACYADDEQIARIVIEKGQRDKDNARVEITVEAM